MKKGDGWRRLLCVVALAVLATACSTPERESAPSPAAAQAAADGCALGADRIVERLEGFLDELPQQTPDEFLAQDTIEGLPAFQDDVAGIIAETTDQRSTLCNLDGLQTLIAERLTEVEAEGVLETFLLNTVLLGGELATSDVVVSPGDDVEAVLALLDDGSSVTFEAGTYEFERPLIVQRDIAVVGAGQDATLLQSSSPDAAIVVVGSGVLRSRDLTIEHVGTEQASVVVAFGRPVDLAATTLRGGVPDGEGAGGNGLVLSDDVFGGGDFDAAQPQSVVVDTHLEGNEGAGLVVDGVLTPVVQRAVVADNGICGACFFGAGGGVLESSRFEGNSFGVQVGDQGSVTARGNTVRANTVAGFVVVGEASVVIEDNAVVDNLEVGIVVQEAASATVRNNTIGAHPFGISVLSTGDVELVGNMVEGAEVGMQIDETSTPTVRSNTVSGTSIVGIAHAGASAGSFTQNVVEPASGAGVLVESTSTPAIQDLGVVGGEVGLAVTGDAAPVLSGARFVGQNIALQADGMSLPILTELEVRDVIEAGLVFRGSALVEVDGVVIAGFGEVGIAVADKAVATVVGATVSGGVNGVSLIGEGRSSIVESSFTDVEVGVQVGESAMPTLEGNEVLEPRAVGFVFVDEAAGEMHRNRVVDPAIVGVQLGGTAAPTIEENVFFFTRPEGAEPITANEEGVDPDATSGGGIVAGSDTSDTDVSDVDVPAEDSVVGLLYADDAAGSARSNQVVGFVIGFQVGDRAMPELVDNTIDGGVWLGVGVLYRDDSAGRFEGNETANHGVGIQLSDRTSASVVENAITRVRDVAILVQGAANPVLEKNICPEGIAGIGLLDDTSPTLIDNECVEVSG